MMKTILTNICLAATVCAVHGVSAATIARVLSRQQWPWSAKVHVDYRLLNIAGENIEVTVAVTNGMREIVLPSRALTGPRMGRLASGDYRLTIDAAKIDFAGADRLDDFKVALSVKSAPSDADLVLYRIYDLSARTRKDVTKAELLNGDYGDVETSYDFAKGGTFSPAEVVVWTGVTNNPAYKTNCLVMRYVPAGSFEMLPNTTNGLEVTISKPYYIGVFEMTFAQCQLVQPNRAKMYFSNETCRATRPMDGCTFDHIRGNSGRNWPADGTVSGTSTYIYGIRRITGENTFDLPTEARWEYAARAGTTTWWNNGGDERTTGGANTVLPMLGRTKYSGGYIGGSARPDYDVDAGNGTASVGSYLPNAWGIYDCHGNVAEWCLDRWTKLSNLAGGVDPKGNEAADSKTRTIRGNYWGKGPASSHMDYRTMLDADMDMIAGEDDKGGLGFRLVCEAEDVE